MKIVVISDTHIPNKAKDLPKTVWDEFNTSGVCIHAGDWVSKSFYMRLVEKIEVHGVHGNMDNLDLMEMLPKKKIVDLYGVRIGITHGCGAPASIIDYVNNVFKNERNTLDIIIFGHTHNPLNKTINGILYFNPGSLTDKVFAPYNSFGIIEIGKDKKINAKIIRI